MNRDVLSTKRDNIIALWQYWIALRQNSKRQRMNMGLYGLAIYEAIYLRYTLFSIHTSDYDAGFSRWYDFIRSHGGFTALKYNISNYNVSYFYLYTLMTYLPIPKIISYKLIPVCFDLVMALFVYLIVRLKYKESSMPTIASLIVLFTPTVFILSAMWGQFESIYASLTLGCLYFLLRKRPFWACFCFGLAVSFKPQPLFFFPLLFILLMTGEIRFRYFLMIPVTYLITMLPACLLGRGFIDLLTTYRSRADNPTHSLNMNFPNIFQWLPAGPFSFWDHVGFLMTLSAIGILSFIVLISRRNMTNEIVLKLALVFVLIVPFFMPEMHERYYYLADVISLVYAFYFPKYFYVPILVQISSFAGYTIYLRKSGVIGFAIDMRYIVFLVLGVIMITTTDLVKALFSTSKEV